MDSSELAVAVRSPEELDRREIRRRQRVLHALLAALLAADGIGFVLRGPARRAQGAVPAQHDAVVSHDARTVPAAQHHGPRRT
jgi:hypothetical protein